MKALVLTFPFPLFIDLHSPPQVSVIELRGAKLRFYPPFRSGPANWLGAPHVRADRVPFLEGQAPSGIKPNSTLLAAVAHPVLSDNPEEAGTIQVNFSGNWGSPPRMFPMDSLRIDVLDQEKDQSISVSEIVQTHMAHLRVKSRQWWIGKALDPVQGWMRNEFKIDESGAPLGDPGAIARSQALIGIERAVDAGMWGYALGAVSQQKSPLIADEMFLDAHYYRACLDYRRMVIDAATACEIEKNLAFERLWKRSRSDPYRQGKAQKGYDITKHLSVDIERLGEKSLAEEDPDLFRQLSNLWSARGSVAHGNPASYPIDGGVVILDEARSKDLLDAAYRCIAWLRAIR